MSILKVEVLQIDNVFPHSDPETISLEVVHIKGWQCVVKKGSFKAGELCVYFPLDSILPDVLAQKINVSNFLSKGRVKAVKLRGEPSYGLVIPLPDIVRVHEEISGEKISPVLDDDLRETLGVKKWEPPQEFKSNDVETPHPLLFEYTDIQNMRSYPGIILDGEEVIITEKIHGMNSRHARIEDIYMVGSHGVRLKENPQNKFWHTFNQSKKDLLCDAGGDSIIYGELFGSGIQDLQYGLERGAIDHQCFDIRVNGKFLSHDEMVLLCDRHGVRTVPVLYRGPFSMDVVLSFSKSSTSINGGKNMMEGVIIKPVKERQNPKIGRVILKYVFDQYINRKKGTEKH